MKVILFQAVDTLGQPGDIVEVKAGYFRNYLFPKNMAEEATEGTLKRLTAKRRKLEGMASDELQVAENRAKELAEVSLEFSRRADEKEQLFGSVGVGDISRALTEKEIEIQRRNIVLKAPIKALGEHEVDLRLHPKVSGPIKITVVKTEE